MRLVITTGSFGFNQLIDRIILSIDIISLQYNEIYIQYGMKEPESLKNLCLDGIPVRIHKVRYYSDINEFVMGADLIITHGGTGTVISLLGNTSLLGNIPFIVIPNKELINNHQVEYCNSISSDIFVSDLDSVVNDILKGGVQKRRLGLSESLWAEEIVPYL
ncbi:hypothetical protein NERG_02207 [Nematocida ausubeli]|uniref:UDP-N-acetylglucosamine transferase subunit ALG13 n=1 Tax=Nematocida ausubeli (strain ATCC PRA-371 / ERTm2) TaxID=1913371 RepID=H8ZF38_NEMA1|nr:hypothetical protein NERG_02207 [Nematocida ausubeli]